MDPLDRRTVLRASGATAGALAFAGCLGAGGSPDIVWEWSWNDRTAQHDEVPEELHTTDYPYTFEYAVIDFTVEKGSFDAQWLMTKVHLDLAAQSFDPSGVEITSPDQRLITDAETSYTMEEGTEGILYIKFDEDLPNNPKLRTGDLQDEGVGVREVEE